MVGETIEKTVIRIEADVRKALEELEKVKESMGDVGTEVDKASRKTSTAGKAMEAALKSVAIYAAAAAAAIGAIGVKSIFVAGDAEEIRNKFEAVFKSSSGSAERWAENFSDTVGRSTLETLQYLSTFQDTFVPLEFDRETSAELSKQLVQLSVDLASFNNELDTDAIASLQSALVGNHETVRRYGIIITQTTLNQELMNMGLSRGIQEATEQEKVMARLNIITNSTADAQGDAARTADSFSNQMRALKGNLKDVMAEAGKDGMDDLSQTLIEFNAWGTSGGYDDITTFLSDVATVAADAADAVSFLTRGFVDLYGTIAPGGLRAQMDNATGTSGTKPGQGIADFGTMSEEELTNVLVQLGYNEDQVASKIKHRNDLLEAGKEIIEEQTNAVEILNDATSSTKIPSWAGQSDYIRERLTETGGRNIGDLLGMTGVSSNIGGGQSINSMIQTGGSQTVPTVSLVEINRNGFNTLASKIDSVVNAVNNISINVGSGGGGSSRTTGDIMKESAIADKIRVTPRWL